MSDAQAFSARSRSETIAQRSVSGLCALALALQIGCFSYLPVQSVPPVPAQQVGVVINDRGRVLLGDRQDGSIVVDVYRVTDLRGNTATWTGERVSIPDEAILGYRARTFSKMKTLLLVGSIVMAIVASVGKSLDLFGDELAERPGEGPQQS